MWEIKTFRTIEAMQTFLDRNGHKIQWHEIAINNGYGIQYRKLRVIG